MMDFEEFRRGIEPCPVCGSTKLEFSSGRTCTFGGWDVCSEPFVRCGCGFQVDVHVLDDISLLELRDAWNRRVKG